MTSKTNHPTNRSTSDQCTPGKRRRRTRRPASDSTRNGNDRTVERNVEPARFAGREPGDRPVLRFAPDAWAKLLWLRDRGDTEVGGFGITDPNDPLRVVEFVTVRQACTAVSVVFDDEAVADYFEDQLDAGRRPEQCGRIWIHTHPGQSAAPSALDEETFARVFGVCDWAVMFIIARAGARYARLRFNVAPGVDKRIRVRVDYNPPFGAAAPEAWAAEYRAHIQRAEEAALGDGSDGSGGSGGHGGPGGLDALEWLEADGAEWSNGQPSGCWLDQFRIDPEVLALLDEEQDGANEIPFTEIELDPDTDPDTDSDTDPDTGADTGHKENP